jgi:hypothetical protein
MESAIVSAIAVLALAAWRFVFAGLQRRAGFGGVAAAHDNTLDRRPPILEQPCVEVITENGWNPGSYRINPIEAKSRAETYLGRIVALVGAAKKGNSYVLDVGTTRFRFRVRDRYVRRLRDASDPKCAYEETCFYSGFQGMPKAEQIAAAMLQFRNNPALFDRWALQRDLAFKADGHVFARVR